MSIWNLIQQVQIENLKAQQALGRSDSERVASRSRAQNTELYDRIGRLILLTEAMWELISERFGITTAELAAKVREIDARDGRIDERRSVVLDAAQIRCPSCEAVVPQGKTTCQFCGAEAPEAKADPFRL